MVGLVVVVVDLSLLKIIYHSLSQVVVVVVVLSSLPLVLYMLEQPIMEKTGSTLEVQAAQAEMELQVHQ